MDLAIDDKNLSSTSQHRESPIALPPFSLSNAQVFQAAMSATNASLQQQSSSAAPSFPSGVPPTLLSTSQIFTNSQSNPSSANSTSKYAQLLGVIEELGLCICFCLSLCLLREFEKSDIALSHIIVRKQAKTFVPRIRARSRQPNV